MRKSSFIFSALMLCGLASCTMEPLQSETLLFQTGKTIVLEASAGDENTKTAIDESNNAITWVAGDKISLFFGPGSAGGSCFTTESAGSSATFYGSINAYTAGGEDYDGGTTYFWGIYPYNASASCTNTSVTTTLPSSQVGKAGTFANGLNLSVGRSENLKMAFYNVCSMYRIKVGVAGITSAKLSTRGGEPLAGTATIEFVDGKPAVTSLTGASSEITLIPEDGEFIPGEYYYFEFFPTTAAEGFEITLYTEFQKATFTKEDSRTFARNEIGGVSALETKVGEWSAKDGFITFVDEKAENACLKYFDSDSDGKISYAEAVAVTSLDGLFNENNDVVAFPELRFFINVTNLQGAFTNCANLTGITIPPTVTTLGAEAFKGCSSLSEIVIPDNVTNIGDSSFEGCTGLKEIIIPAGVTSIERKAFKDCTGLRYFFIPSSVSSIGNMAFSGCTSMQTVELERTAPCTISAESFDAGITVIVPSSALNDYKQASYWMNHRIISPSDLSSNGTANSYIVSSNGDFKLKSVKGNSSTSIGSVASVETLWETFGTDTAPTVGDLVNNVCYTSDYIIFTSSALKGNAVIAAKDSNGEILWSWHIWLTDQPEDQVYNNNAGTLMDRNLGATSATPGEVQALGLFYQWGRKDPFLGSPKIIKPEAKAASTGTWPSSIRSDSSTGTIDYAIAHPMTYIFYNYENEDWYYTGSESTDNTRWQTSDKDKGLYDPCPPGYRVPDGGSSGVWSKAFGYDSEWSTTNWDNQNKGINFGESDKTLGTSSMIWYPAAGYLSFYDGSLAGVSWSGGSCWSASPSGQYAYSVGYDDENISPSGNGPRSNGQSVRCIKE